jgi:hypothetical protein
MDILRLKLPNERPLDVVDFRCVATFLKNARATGDAQQPPAPYREFVPSCLHAKLPEDDSAMSVGECQRNNVE